MKQSILLLYNTKKYLRKVASFYKKSNIRFQTFPPLFRFFIDSYCSHWWRILYHTIFRCVFLNFEFNFIRGELRFLYSLYEGNKPHNTTAVKTILSIYVPGRKYMLKYLNNPCIYIKLLYTGYFDNGTSHMQCGG